MCVRERERERESVSVSVSVSERGIERESECKHAKLQPFKHLNWLNA